MWKAITSRPSAFRHWPSGPVAPTPCGANAEQDERTQNRGSTFDRSMSAGHGGFIAGKFHVPAGSDGPDDGRPARRPNDRVRPIAAPSGSGCMIESWQMQPPRPFPPRPGLGVLNVAKDALALTFKRVEEPGKL